MKLKVLAVSLLAMFALSTTAQAAIDGGWAVRQIKKYVEEDCNSAEARQGGFRCLGWQVYHCYKLGKRKVRCYALQEYAHNAHLRTCYFKISLIEWPNEQRASFNEDGIECFNESF